MYSSCIHTYIRTYVSTYVLWVCDAILFPCTYIFTSFVASHMPPSLHSSGIHQPSFSLPPLPFSLTSLPPLFLIPPSTLTPLSPSSSLLSFSLHPSCSKHLRYKASRSRVESSCLARYVAVNRAFSELHVLLTSLLVQMLACKRTYGLTYDPNTPLLVLYSMWQYT